MPRRTHSETVESLINLVLQSVRFRSRESLIYSRIPWQDGHQSVLLHDEVGRAWLAAQYLDICHEPPSQSALSQAIATATSLSLIGVQKVDCPLRVHWDGSPRRPRTIYLDRRTNGEVVEITAAGYRVTYEHLLDFRATFHEEILPAPEEPAGPVNALTSLRGLLNLREDRAWIRCLLWLLAAFRPAGPYPPLVLHGPEASGKSTAARMLRALVDPNQMPLRAVPRSPSALAELAWRNHVLAFDDVHRIPPVAESNLARLASGGAFEFRDPHLKSPLAFAAARPLLFTTRNPRLHLGGRAIQVELPDIAPQRRRGEADLFDEFEALRPQLGAVLYAALAAALANFDRVSAPALPRHADAALWMLAAAPSLGLTAQEILAALDLSPSPDAPGAAPTGGQEPIPPSVATEQPAWPHPASATPQEILSVLRPNPSLETPGVPPAGGDQSIPPSIAAEQPLGVVPAPASCRRRAAGTPLLATAEASLGAVVEERRITTLPLFGGNALRGLAIAAIFVHMYPLPPESIAAVKFRSCRGSVRIAPSLNWAAEMPSSPTYEPIEGANALGLGYSPFEQKLLEFKPRLFELDYEGDAERRWFTPEQAGYAEVESAGGAARKVSVPRCVLFDPTGERGDFQSELFESRSQVENSFAAGAQIRGGFGLFSAAFEGSYKMNKSESQKHSFAHRYFHSKLWSLSLHLPEAPRVKLAPHFQNALESLDGASDDGSAGYDDFFHLHGTHYVAAAKAGAKASLFVAIAEAAKLSKEEMSAQLDIDYGLCFHMSGSAESRKLDERYSKNRRENRSYVGGYSDQDFDDWIKTARHNPGIIDFALKGIWEILPDEAQRKQVKAAFEGYCFRNSSYALRLNGAGSFVDVASQRGLDRSFDEMTMEAWIYPTGEPTNSPILSKEGAFQMYRFVKGEIQPAFGNAKPGWRSIPTKIVAPLNRWIHLALVYSARDQTLVCFADGNRRISVRVEGPVHPSRSKLRLGGNPANTDRLEGYLSEVRIWDRALDDETIQQNMYRRLNGTEPGLVGLWPLNDAADDKTADRSPNANHGMLRDASWGEPPAPPPIHEAIVRARMQRAAHQAQVR